jgi:CoA:oxalate CoA-transferase
MQPTPMGNENVTAAPSGAFQTGEGLLNIAANKQEQFVSLCGVIGRPELLDDPRFAKPDARMANRYVLRDLVEQGLASASAAEWEARLNRVGVPAGRVLTVPQVLDEPQVTQRGMVVEFDNVTGVDRPIAVVRGGFLVDGEAPQPTLPPPALGEHSDEILAEIAVLKGPRAARSPQ